MRYTVSHDMNPGGELTRETDLQIMVSDSFVKTHLKNVLHKINIKC